MLTKRRHDRQEFGGLGALRAGRRVGSLRGHPECLRRTRTLRCAN
jgi:hypothetical protein